MSRRCRITTMIVTAGALLLVPFASADPPAVSITSGPSNPTSETSASFGFTVDDPLAVVQCSLDGGGFSLCGSGVSYSGLGDGTHTFVVRASNLLLETGSDTQSWAVDNTGPSFSPPDIVVDATGVAGAIVSFSPGASDPHGPTSVTCSPASGTTFSIGTTTVACTATDSLGNTTSGSFTVTVRDVTPPTLTLPGPLTVNVNAALSATVTYSATAQDGGDFVDAVLLARLGREFRSRHHHRHVHCDGSRTATSPAGPSPSRCRTRPIRHCRSPVGRRERSAPRARASRSVRTRGRSPVRSMEPPTPLLVPGQLTGLPSGAHTFHVRATDTSGNVCGWLRGHGPSTPRPRRSRRRRPSTPKRTRRVARWSRSSSLPPTTVSRFSQGRYRALPPRSRSSTSARPPSSAPRLTHSATSGRSRSRSGFTIRPSPPCWRPTSRWRQPLRTAFVVPTRR